MLWIGFCAFCNCVGWGLSALHCLDRAGHAAAFVAGIHRGQTAGQRAVISQRGYAATRLGVEALSAQLHREALARGLGQAQLVLIIADGAIWIWNLAKDRFPDARQQLDLFHAEEHLWAVAHDLYGRGTPEAQALVAPLLQQVRDDQTVAVIASLTELKPRLLEAQQKKIQTQIEYFEHNAPRMKYKEILQARRRLPPPPLMNATRPLPIPRLQTLMMARPKPRAAAPFAAT